jgi:hypothetical protein
MFRMVLPRPALRAAEASRARSERVEVYHEEISKRETSAGRRIALHGVDAVGLVHALLLRIQALLLPIKTLVLSSH